MSHSKGYHMSSKGVGVLQDIDNPLQESKIFEIPSPQITSNSNSNSSSTPTNSSTTTTTKKMVKPKIKRSRNGCFSCKKMKIKCGEQKPSCEYCAHTGRECIYLPPKQLKITKHQAQHPPISLNAITSTFAALQSSTIQRKLNSPQGHLEITNFEHRLLSTYASFAEEFFTYHIQQSTHDFWMFDLPQKWSSSRLLKISTFCATSMKLLSKYSYKDMYSISFDDHDQNSNEIINLQTNSNYFGSDILIPRARLNLYEEALKLFNDTSDMVDKHVELLENSNPKDNVELIGQITVGKTVLLSCMSIFPKLSNEAVETKNISKCGLFKLLEITKKFIDFAKKYISYLLGTQYERMFSLKDEIIDISAPNKFPFINYLRDYINATVDSLDLLQISFLNIIGRMEVDCYRALVYDYPIPLATPLAELSQDEDFIVSLKQEHPAAMRIMFYFSALCSILDNKMFKESSIWDEYIEVYRAIMGGGFQDVYDYNVYQCVQARIDNKIPYSLKLLQNLGIKSLQEIMYDSQVVELKTHLSSPYTEVDSTFMDSMLKKN